jgi:PAS domain S-box-containing protein
VDAIRMTERTVLASLLLFGASTVERSRSSQVREMGPFFWVDRDRGGAASFRFSYVMTVVFVAAALAVTQGLHQISPVYPTFFAFYAAVAASAWYGGYGPGWVSVVLSTLAVNYFFLPPLYSLAPSSADLPRLIAFVICAIVANAVSTRQKRVENALRVARDGLEQQVREGTAELQSTNESLSAEVEERKRVESAFRAGEEWWRTIFEASNVPMAVTDLSGRHIMVNAAAERVLGYSSEELRSISIAELTHEDDRDITLPLFDELTSGQRKDYHVTKRYRCKDGSVKWLSATVTRVPDPRGGPDVTASIVTDITEQKRVEQELRASEERWRKVFEHAPTGIAMVGADRRLFAANPACTSMLGYDESELRQMTAADFSFEDERELTRSIHTRLLNGEEQWVRLEKRYRRSNGEIIWGDASLFRVPATENTPAFVTAMVVDITERKRAEESLRASEARWRSIFEHSVVGIGTTDRERRYLSANPALQQMLGYSEEELRGLTLADVTHPDDCDATDRGLKAVWERRQESYHIEKRMIRKDGEVIRVNITGAPVPATESDPAFLPAIVVNITEQKQAEEALRQSRAELARVSRLTTMGELTASISHEVNQPLAAIVASGNACRRWLASDQPNLERARDSVDRITRDAHRASEIITRIRSMTKKAPPAQLPVDLNGVIADVLSFARGELVARGISIRPALLEDLPSIAGDRVQLQQVVLNLVMNAVEAMASVTGRERVLAITSRRANDGSPILTVEDSGLGLDAANADRIFDAFFTTKPGGMGMGLSISTSIVEAHGGRLWASPNLPHGTAFHFTLPIGGGTEGYSDKAALVTAC